MPSLTLTLEALAVEGVVLPSEIRAAVDASLPLKRLDAGLVELGLWGRLRTSSGKDYYVAVGHRTVPYFFEQRLVEDRKMYISQNGFSWVDLPACTAQEKIEAAAKITAWLTGDLAYVNSVSSDSSQPAFAEGEENAEGVPPTVVDVTEIERIAWIIAEISGVTRIVPNGYVITNAKNEFVTNKSYGGLTFPDNLDSYSHYAGAPLTSDMTGMWALSYDSFKQTSVIRHIEWPGFTFFFSNATKICGDFYFGSGVKNNDVLFMI